MNNTITIFANADLTLQSAIANEKATNSYAIYTATTSDSENSFTVEAFTPKTIELTAERVEEFEEPKKALLPFLEKL